MKSAWSTKRSWNSLNAGGFLGDLFLVLDFVVLPPYVRTWDFDSTAFAWVDSMRCRYTYSIAFNLKLACEFRPVPLLN